MPSLRPQSVFRCVFSSSLTLCCSAGPSPFPSRPPSLPPTLQGPDFVEPKLQKLTSWSCFALPLLFVGLPVLPGRELPDARTAGEIILSFCFCQEFFFWSLSPSESPETPLFPLFSFFHLLGEAAGLYRIYNKENSNHQVMDRLVTGSTLTHTVAYGWITSAWGTFVK